MSLFEYYKEQIDRNWLLANTKAGIDIFSVLKTDNCFEIEYGVKPGAYALIGVPKSGDIDQLRDEIASTMASLHEAIDTDTYHVREWDDN